MRFLKKLVASLLVGALLLTVLPSVFAATPSDNTPDMDAINAVWEEIYTMQDSVQTKSTNRDEAAIAEKAAAIVEHSDTYVADSLQWNGNASFVWNTTQGVPCHYSPYLQQQAAQRKNLFDDSDSVDESVILSHGLTKLSTDTYFKSYSNDDANAQTVYLFGPYYGIDVSFSEGYLVEAMRMASAIGGKLLVLTRNAATVDAIGKAMQTGKMVLIDTHGDTDYYNAYFDTVLINGAEYIYKIEDATSRANSSYLCLQTGSTITSTDERSNQGDYGWYSYAYYAGSNGNMYYYEVNGTAITNHMSGTASGGFAWIGSCLGMSTSGIAEPLMQKGMGGVYGYGDSITFYGDLCYLEVFTNNLVAGHSVARSVAAMKATYGKWDPAYRYYYKWYDSDDHCWYYDYYYTNTQSNNTYYTPTLYMLQKDMVAFPFVVSAYDAYPGQKNAHNFQTVGCDWYLTQPASIHDPYYDVPDGVWYTGAIDYVLSNQIMSGMGRGSFSPETSLNRAQLVTILYNLEGKPDVSFTAQFPDVISGRWFTTPVEWAAANGIVSGYPDGTFQPGKTITRQEIATILYRYANVKGIDTSARASLSSFPDASGVNRYATDAMQWTVAEGLISGSNGKLLPQAAATRAQTATIVMRFLDKHPISNP